MFQNKTKMLTGNIGSKSKIKTQKKKNPGNKNNKPDVKRLQNYSLIMIDNNN